MYAAHVLHFIFWLDQKPKQKNYRGEAPTLGIFQASLTLPLLKWRFQDFACFTRKISVYQLKSVNSLLRNSRRTDF